MPENFSDDPRPTESEGDFSDTSTGAPEPERNEGEKDSRAARKAEKQRKKMEKDPEFQRIRAEKEFIGDFDASCETPEAVAAKYETDIENGLTEAQAAERKERFGANHLLEAKKETVLHMFLSEFKDPLVLILLVAALIDAIFAIINMVSGVNDVEDWAEVAVIIAVVLLDAIIGTVQEAKASKALEALKKMSSPNCTVRREGKIRNIRAEDVVIGDIVILEEGTIAPADIRLTKTVNMKSDEASLTGESVPSGKSVEKILPKEHALGDEDNIAHSSCPISYGRGEGIVVATGMNTQIGKIAGMLSEEEEQTPLQKKLAQLSKVLGIICVAIVAAMFVVGILWLIPDMIAGTFNGESIKTLFMQAIALAVAAIPEGLPAVVTIVLAMGMSRMVKVNTIVRKLPSVETLGSVTYVCSDKTGTLTQNKMTIMKIYADGKISDADAADISVPEVELLTKGMMLCSNASIDGDRYGDPTELALLDFAARFDLGRESTERSSLPRRDELPFDSVRKMMSVKSEVLDRDENSVLKRYAYTSSDSKESIIFTKGALDSILADADRIAIGGEIRPITPEDIAAINAASKELAEQAYRVLAMAIHGSETIDESHLIYVGMVAMIDPPRAEAKPAVSEFHRAGITTVMITGDHADTALAIGRELGIASDISQTMTGQEIDRCTPEELQERVKTTRIFARVSPQNKVDIVKALKANGEIVAMTGDGVNDAPSLKAADVGIAMGITGTDVAKGAADMVLADDNFASIEKAVEEGRGIFSNIKKTIFFLLSSNFAEILLMFLATCANIIQPLSAMQLLWINLITDSLPAVALGRDDKDPNIMAEKPRDPKDGVFAHGGFKFCLFYGAVIFVCVFAAFLVPVLIGMTSTSYSTSNLNLGVLIDNRYSLIYEDSMTWNQLMQAESIKEELVSVTGGMSWESIANILLDPDSNPAMYAQIEAHFADTTKYAMYISDGTLDANEIVAAITIFEDARTMAFTTLAFAELFHMLGMSNVKRSVVNVFRGKNWFFIVAFGAGVVLQVIVCEVPGLTTLFLGHSNGLCAEYWGYSILLSLVPLIVHEIMVPYYRNRNVI